MLKIDKKYTLIFLLAVSFTTAAGLEYFHHHESNSDEYNCQICQQVQNFNSEVPDFQAFTADLNRFCLITVEGNKFKLCEIINNSAGRSPPSIL